MLRAISMKEHTTTNVLIKGLWWSGSGAVVDWLSEHNEAKLYGIFDTFLVKNGIGDIINSNEAAEKKRLAQRLIKQTIKKFINLRYKEIKNDKKSILKNCYRKPHNRFSHVFKTVRHLYAYEKLIEKQADFDEIDFFNKFIHNLRPKGLYKYLIFDQVIDIGYHNTIWQEVFSPFKLVIVHRNPRDQLAQLVRQNKFGKSSNHIRIKPNNKELLVDFFFRVVNLQYENVLTLTKAIGKEQLAIIPFEGFVSNHLYYRKQVCSFLGISDSQNFTAKKFDPNVSVHNIGIAEKDNVERIEGYSEAKIKKLENKRALLFELPHSI